MMLGLPMPRARIWSLGLIVFQPAITPFREDGNIFSKLFE
jgi:hypothetical protein